MASTATAISLLDAVKSIEPIIHDHASASERDRRLARATVDAMQSAGLYRMCKPRALGGLEVDAVTALRVAEEVARIHPAAGWNLQISVAGFSFVSWLPEEGVAEALASPDARLAGAFAPPGKAVPVDGGYTVSGRWPFGSGSHDADWLIGGSFIFDPGSEAPRKNDQGQPIQLATLFPAADVTLLDTWHTMGMRDTGSTDFTVKNVFVPARRAAYVAPIDSLTPSCSIPIYRLGLWFAVAILPAPALGAARAAIDALLELGRRKKPNYSPATVSERPVAQLQLARAEAMIGAARAYLYQTVGEVWNSALDGRFLTESEKIKVQLAACHAVASAAEAIDLVHAAAGTSGIREEQPFERAFRDVHVMTQHAFASAARFESAGKLMFGQPTDWPFFAL